MKRCAFAKVGVEDALSKTTRDPSKSLGLVANKKKREEITATI
jgi:hypothetical protein